MLVFHPLSGFPRPRRSVALGLLLWSASPVGAQERLVRTFGPEAGLTSTPAWAVAQDSVGFLWIGTEGGLFRFDGTEFLRWAPDSIRKPVGNVTVAPDGRVAALEVNGRVFEVTADGARTITQTNRTRSDAYSLVYDRRGVLWQVEGGAVHHRGAADRWHQLPGELFDGEQARLLRANSAGAVDVLTEVSLWRVTPGEPPRRLVSNSSLPMDAFTLEDGRTVVLTNREIIELAADGRQLNSTTTAVPGRTIAAVERGGTIWVAFDNSLLAIRPGAAPERTPFGGTITYGGPLLVDREGSLWMASNALHQFPEPETLIWDDVRWGRFLERSGAALWIGTWGRTAVVQRTAAGWSLTEGPDRISHMCADSSGSIWASASGSLLELGGSSVTSHALGPRGLVHCTASRGGGVWLGHAEGIVHVRAGDVSGRVIPPPEPLIGNTARAALLHDSRDRLWASIDPDRMCYAAVSSLLAGRDDAWSCERVEGMHVATDMVELPSGTLWLATHSAGLFAREGEKWRSLHTDSLPTQTVLGLRPSPRGGVWMAGHGFVQRIGEGADDQPVLLERITQWHGFPGPATADIIDDPNGDVWLTYDGGLVRVPAGVRSSRYAPPAVALVEATIDGAPVPVGTPLELPHDRNRLELRFAALSFRNPSQLRHQVRLGPDEPWSASRGSPSFRWVDLRPGDYEVEYRASLDGVDWSVEPVRFAFTVLPPWYATAWMIALAALFLTGAGWAIYRARVAYLLGLERQRTRIAMDLHDEMGSGLASIGILAGVLAEPDGSRHDDGGIAREVAITAEELGASLSDIVWSLDPQGATLQQLAARLAEHGSRLFAVDVQFDTEFPREWPEVALSLPVLRSVLLIGLEALHNAARHAGAERVLLSLQTDGAAWVLTVRDDGAGLAVAANRAWHGRGLRSMRRRAAEIGVELGVASAPGTGTTVSLRFEPSPRRSRLLRWLRPPA
jgi:signal transduction histidine kinase/ligand-binding sensor domain-containing protein